ncbi:hypothetical protein B0293_07720 [Amycolatopsis azurea DSM 43854]|uniref:Uncharacterized protein n=2 Tax=Amycolatopsis azurea TaxID=36819 RepID=M2PYC7_9PSEU|nr:hypothetical protein C791_2992 [Amycolatopsis azurea DSM 43854]OOC07547.1 hypothetical protein B0293_07720 [Amycolatopsis azurea DSM 43854]
MMSAESRHSLRDGAAELAENLLGQSEYALAGFFLVVADLAAGTGFSAPDACVTIAREIDPLARFQLHKILAQNADRSNRPLWRVLADLVEAEL